MAGGGQVITVPDNYWGGMAIGSTIGAIATALREKDEKTYEDFVRDLSIRKAAGESEEDTAAWIAQSKYGKKLGEIKPEVTPEKRRSRTITRIMDKRDSGETPTPREQAILDRFETNELNVDTALRRDKATTTVTEQAPVIGEQNIKLNEGQLKTQALDLISRADETFGKNSPTANAIAQAQASVLGEVTLGKRQLTMQDIEAGIAEKLAGDPEALKAYQNLKTVGDVRGPRAAAGTLNLEDSGRRANIRHTDASTAALNAQAAREQAAADNAGTVNMLELFKPAMNALVEFGADPLAVAKHAQGLELSELEKSNIANALTAKNTKEGKGPSEELLMISTLNQRKLPIPPGMYEKAIAKYMTETTGTPMQAVEKKAGLFGNKTKWEIAPVTAPTAAPGQGAPDPVAILRGRFEEALKSGTTAEAIKADLMLSPDGPERQMALGLLDSLTAPAPTNTPGSVAPEKPATSVAPKVNVQQQIDEKLARIKELRAFKLPRGQQEPGADKVKRRNEIVRLNREVSDLRKKLTK